MGKPPVIAGFQQHPSKRPLWLALTANLLSAVLSVQFYWVTPGARIRPMAWAFWVLWIAAAGFIAVPLGWSMFRQHPQRAITWLTAILALTPFPLAMAILWHAAWLKGFTLSP